MCIDSDILQHDQIAIRVIDAYSVKPLDIATIYKAVRTTSERLVVVEDHRAEGGLGSAVFEACATWTNGMAPLRLHAHHLAIRDLPGSGSPQELLDAHGISARQAAIHARDYHHRILLGHSGTRVRASFVIVPDYLQNPPYKRHRAPIPVE